MGSECMLFKSPVIMLPGGAGRLGDLNGEVGEGKRGEEEGVWRGRLNSTGNQLWPITRPIGRYK